MGCICELQAGDKYLTSPSFIGQLWVFQNLKPEELAALVRAALRKVYKKGQEVFCQGAPGRHRLSPNRRLSGRYALLRLYQTGLRKISAGLSFNRLAPLTKNWDFWWRPTG
jgi:hypothetical protein